MKYGTLTILLLTLFSCTTNQTQTETPPVLPVLTIVSSTETTYQEYPAAIEGALNVEIRPQVSGTIDDIFVDEGSFVNAGTALLKINDRVYTEALNTAKAAQAAAEGARLNAQLEVEKISQLAANKVVSDYQLRTAQAQLKIANANVEQTKAQVAAAQINVSYATIKAPVSGYIGRLNKRQGSLVNPQDLEPLTTLSDVHNVRAYFSLSETDFINFKEQYTGKTLQEKLKHVPPAELVLSNGETHNAKGKIDMVDGQFDRNTSAITLRATFPNTEGLLRSGNTGRVRLSLNHTNVNLVPTSATIEIQDKIFVYMLDDSNKVNKQPITIIGKSSNNYLVKKGVKKGNRIVTSGIDHLQEGQEITPDTSIEKMVKNIEKSATGKQ